MRHTPFKAVVLAGLVPLVGASAMAASGSQVHAAAAGPRAELRAANNVVVGAVIDRGKGVAGATIRAVLMPNDRVLSALPVGAVVPTRSLPSVKTDLNGGFAVPMDMSLPSTYLDAKGRPSLQLNITGAGKTTTWNWTAAKGSTGGWTTTLAQSDGEADTPETLVIDMAKGSVSELEGVQAESFIAGTLDPSVAQANAPANRTTSDALASAGPDVPCVTVAGEWFTNRVEPFAHVYPGRTMAATITQRFGVDHTIGVAIDLLTGWAGGHAGGHHTVSLQASGSKRLTANSTAFNSLNLRAYNPSCGRPYRQAVSQYAILSRIDSAAEPNFTECTLYGPGYTLVKRSGTNITYSSEVNVGAISVDAQSGWTTDTEITWVSGGTRNSLCGSNGFGWASAPQAEANSA